jgi:hypothetical protein
MGKSLDRGGREGRARLGPFIERGREREREASGMEEKRPAITTPLMAINGGLHWGREREMGEKKRAVFGAG